MLFYSMLFCSTLPYSILFYSILIYPNLSIYLSIHLTKLSIWLGNVLRATRPCTFSTSELPKLAQAFFSPYFILTSSCASGAHFSASDLAKVVWEWCVLSILAWTCASRRNSVQVFVSHLATWLRTGCFSEPTLLLSQHFARPYLLSSDSDSFSLFFSLLPLSSLWLFPSLLFISPYCRKFDLKTRSGTVLYC